MSRLRAVAVSPRGYLAAAAIAVALLAIGAYHPASMTPAARAANLDSELRCPSCASASLAQSETVSANQLKATIRRWIAQGRTDAEIERRLVAAYGPGELLRPTSWLVWAIPAGAIGLGAVALAFALRRRARLSLTPEDEQMVTALLAARRAEEGDG